MPGTSIAVDRVIKESIDRERALRRERVRIVALLDDWLASGRDVERGQQVLTQLAKDLCGPEQP